MQAERDLAQDTARAVAGADAVQGQKRPRQFGGSGELPVEIGLALQRRDLRQPRQPLEAALHLARLAGLGAEARHARLDVRSSPRLLGGERRAAAGLRGVRRLEGAVVAGVAY